MVNKYVWTDKAEIDARKYGGFPRKAGEPISFPKMDRADISKDLIKTWLKSGWIKESEQA